MVNEWQLKSEFLRRCLDTILVAALTLGVGFENK